MHEINGSNSLDSLPHSHVLMLFASRFCTFEVVTFLRPFSASNSPWRAVVRIAPHGQRTTETYDLLVLEFAALVEERVLGGVPRFINSAKRRASSSDLGFRYQVPERQAGRQGFSLRLPSPGKASRIWNSVAFRQVRAYVQNKPPYGAKDPPFSGYYAATLRLYFKLSY